MNEVFVTIYASFFITFSWKKDCSMSQHGAALIRDIEDIAVAFLALVVSKRSIGLLSVLLIVIFFLSKMLHHILYPVSCLGIEEIKGIVRRRQMTVHTISHEPL